MITFGSKETRFSLYGGTAAVLAYGYFDLVRGGTTISALLLGLAYCVLIPMVIWMGADDPTSDRVEPEDRPSYGAAAIVSFVILVLYLVTMAPSTAMWDTSEYIAAAYTFGLPHPPGNPFFVIIGRVFSLLPVAGTVAARINVLAAVCSAIAAGPDHHRDQDAIRETEQQRGDRRATSDEIEIAIRENRGGSTVERKSCLFRASLDHNRGMFRSYWTRGSAGSRRTPLCASA